MNINPTKRELIDNGVFERIIFLSDKKEKGEIEKVYVLNKKSNKTLSKITNFKGKEINLNRFAYILETIYDIFNEFG